MALPASLTDPLLTLPSNAVSRRIDLVDHLSLRNVHLSTSIQLRVVVEQNLRINPAVLYFFVFVICRAMNVSSSMI